MPVNPRYVKTLRVTITDEETWLIDWSISKEVDNLLLHL